MRGKERREERRREGRVGRDWLVQRVQMTLDYRDGWWRRWRRARDEWQMMTTPKKSHQV